MSTLTDTVSFEKKKKDYKIIVLGDQSIGKTTLAARFCTEKFQDVEATVGVLFHEKTVILDGEPLKLVIWDTAGQERFRESMTPSYYRNAKGVVFVYDVTKTKSFENLSYWIAEFNRYQGDCPDITKILVGNKCDCKDRKAVSRSMAKKFADTHGMVLIETSASDDSEADNVKSIFMTIARKLKNREPVIPAAPSRESSSHVEQPSFKLTRTIPKRDDGCCTC